MNRYIFRIAVLASILLLSLALGLVVTTRTYSGTLLIKRIVYYGSTYQCNVCSASFRAFQQGPRSQMELQCPFCLSRPRHRTAYIFFRERTNLFDGTPKRMLHVAPENCFEKMFREIPNMDYISVDLAPGVAMLQMDIMDIKFPDNSFDVIYCSHVLEHVTDDKKAMRELARVLKPGGWAVIAVPILRSDHTFEDSSITSPDARKKYYGLADHLRAYGPDFPARLEEAGFDVEIDNFAKDLPNEMVRRYGLSRESIYIARKNTHTR